MAAINVGTSAALRVMRAGASAKAPFGLFCYRVDSSRFLVGGAVSNAGNLRAWGISNLQTGSPDLLERQMSRRLRPTHGLTVLPFWTTERAPTWNENLSGAILGITQATSAIDILQALTEGTYHRLALIAEMVTKKTGEVEKFLVSGGIQSSKSAMQRLANVMNHPMHPNPEAEASIRGAAVFVLEKLGLPIVPLNKSRPIRPQKKAALEYRQDREKISKLERLLTGHAT
jgi:gluconokinase